MKISKAHQRFAEHLEKPDALENPQNYLGPIILLIPLFTKFSELLENFGDFLESLILNY